MTDKSFLRPFFEYIDMLNTDLKESLKNYTGEGYDDLNRSLRRGHMLQENSMKLLDDIMTIFEGGPYVKGSFTLYRGMGYKSKGTFQHRGLLSTSYNKDSAKKFSEKDCCLYVITLTPGQYTILPLENISESPEEHEVLLPPGMLSVQYVLPSTSQDNEDNIDIIYCTYIPENAELVNIDKESQMSKEVKNVIPKLSLENWVDKILYIIKEDVQLLCDSDETFENCVKEIISTLPYKDDIPEEALKKVITLLSNIQEVL